MKSGTVPCLPDGLSIVFVNTARLLQNLKNLWNTEMFDGQKSDDAKEVIAPVDLKGSVPGAALPKNWTVFNEKIPRLK